MTQFERNHRAGLAPPPDDEDSVEPIEQRVESEPAREEEPDYEFEGEREEVPEDGWKFVETGMDVSLFNVCFTIAGPIAVGGDGKVLHRRPSSGEWRVIIEAGPSVTFNNIHDVDVTDDGERFWFVGDSGIIGAFDVRRGRKYDFSAPMEKTSTWESIAVSGEKGEERVIYANGSGELLDAEMDEHGFPDWGDVKKPGRGSTMPGVDFDTDGTAYAADTTGKAYQLVDGGEQSDASDRASADDSEWVEIGVRNAEVNFHDIDCDDGHLLIAGDDGIVYRFDRFADNWTPIRAGDGTVYSIDQFEGRRAAATADGRMYEPEMMVGWSERPTEVAEDLYGVALGPEYDIAVGAAGTVVERHHENQDRGRFEEPADPEDDNDEPERIAERSRKRRERRKGPTTDTEESTDDDGNDESERIAERSRKRRERRREKRDTVLPSADERGGASGTDDDEEEDAGDDTREEFW